MFVSAQLRKILSKLASTALVSEWVTHLCRWRHTEKKISHNWLPGINKMKCSDSQPTCKTSTPLCRQRCRYNRCNTLSEGQQTEAKIPGKWTTLVYEIFFYYSSWKRHTLVHCHSPGFLWCTAFWPWCHGMWCTLIWRGKAQGGGQRLD